MDLNRLVKQTEKALADNSPAILTGVGVAGTIAGAVLAGKASVRATDILREEEDKRERDAKHYREIYRKQPDNFPIPFWEKVKLVWVEYIPAVGTIAISVSATIMSNRISTKRATAMATAYTVLERGYSEFRERAHKQLGDKGYEKVRTEIAQDRVDRNPNNSQIIISGNEQLCFDSWSGRWFKSDMETIKKAQNDTNYQILREGSCSLSEFWGRIGLDPTSESDDIGWMSDSKPLELGISTILSDDGKPAIYIEFFVVPVRDYWKFG